MRGAVFLRRSKARVGAVGEVERVAGVARFCQAEVVQGIARGVKFGGYGWPLGAHVGGDTGVRVQPFCGPL